MKTTSAARVGRCQLPRSLSRQRNLGKSKGLYLYRRLFFPKGTRRLWICARILKVFALGVKHAPCFHDICGKTGKIICQIQSAVYTSTDILLTRSNSVLLTSFVSSP